ncbi:MAG: hypothetical protein ACI4QN_01580, partial [Candidatus Coproplasma sp.]
KVDEAVNSDNAELKINVAQNAEVQQVELKAKAQVEVSGRIENVVADGNAQNAKVDLKETASVSQVVVKSEGITVASTATSDIKVVVAESVQSIITDVAYETATEQELEQILEHKHIYVVDSTVAATCTEDGKKIYKCIDCDDSYEEAISALEHSYAYKVVKQPTSTEKGIGLYTCTRCGNTKQVEIDNVTSFTVEGVNYLFSLIPDGVYNISADTADLFTFTVGDDKVEISELNGVIKVVNGDVKGTLKFNAEFNSIVISHTGTYDTTRKIAVTCVIDNDSIACKALTLQEDGRGRYEVDGGDMLVSISGLVKNAVMTACGFDIDEIGDIINEYLPFFGEPDEEDANTIIDTIKSVAVILPEIEFFTETKDNDGNTVYTLDVEGLKKYVDDLGKKTPETIINETLGEGTYAIAYAFLKNIPDMTVGQVNTFIDVIAGSVGLGDGQLVELLQTVLNNVAGEGAKVIDIKALIEQYKDYNVMEAAVLIMNNVQLPDNKPNTPSDTPDGSSPIEGDIIQPYALTVDDETKQAAAALKEQYLATLTYINDLATKSSLAEALAVFDFEYANIGAMIDYAKSLVSLEYTVDASNAVIAYSFSFMMDEATCVSVVKTVEDVVPNINVSLMGVVASVTGTSEGIEATLNAFGFTLEALISETANNGVKVEVSLPMGDATTEETSTSLADLILVIDPTDYGAKISVNGKVAESLLGNYQPDIKSLATDTDGEADETNDIVFGGTFKVEKNNGAELDSDLIADSEKLQSAFYHMNATIGASDYYGRAKIEYKSDESGEYYIVTNTRHINEQGISYNDNGVSYYFGYVTEVVNTARIGAVNGLPQFIITTAEDCGDWVQLSIICSAKGNTVSKTAFGLFVINDDGTYTLITQAAGTDIVIEEQENVPVTINTYGYYNLKTGETSSESHHKYTTTAKLVDGATNCEEGLIVTDTCSECDYTRTYVYYDHYCKYEVTPLKTQCGDNSYLTVRTCLGCGLQDVNCSYYEHYNMSKQWYDILTAEEYENCVAQYVEQGLSREDAIKELANNYISVNDLPAELDVKGFYHGIAIKEHCAICGLNVTEYYYYTNTTEDGCLVHDAYLCEYKGNEMFESFTKLAQAAEIGHHISDSKEIEITDVAATTAELNAIVGKLPFTPTEITAYEFPCMGCGHVQTKIYDLTYTDITTGYCDDISLTIYYNDDGEVSTWSYEGELSTISNITALFEEFPEGLEPMATPASGYARINKSNNYTSYNITLYSGTGNTQEVYYSVYGNYGDITVYYKVAGVCEGTKYLYERHNGEWGEPEISTVYSHSYDTTKKLLGICSEDGYVWTQKCSICGYEDEYTSSIYYYHNENYTSVTDVDINNDALLRNKLPGLSAKVSYDWRCREDNVVGNCILTLTDNWTLTSDVYFKAEGLTIDLNGYTIDLNGYNLALYSYDGEQLILTDSTYDTADPDSVTNGIIDSAEEDSKGVLVLFTYTGNITIGTIAIDTDYVLSDKDDRYTIDETVSEDGTFTQAQRDALVELLYQSAPVLPEMEEIYA